MRTSNGVNYPDSVAFLFSPVMFTCEDGTVERLEVTMSRGMDNVVVTHEAFGGACYIDMREYAQGLFGEVEMPSSYVSSLSPMVKGMTYTVRKYANNAWSVAVSGATSQFVWGARRWDETWGASRVLRRYSTRPFMVDLFNLGNQSFVFRGDDGSTGTYTPSAVGLYHVVVPSAVSGADVIKVTDSNGEVTIMREECEDGIMLRWIDRHGMLCHFVFDVGERSYEIGNGEGIQRNNLLMWDGNGWKGFNGNLDRKTRKEGIAIGAALVELEIFDMLTDLASSPIVEMQQGNAWYPVSVEGGTWMKRNVPLQDFECVVLMDDVSVQRV